MATVTHSRKFTWTKKQEPTPPPSHPANRNRGRIPKNYPTRPTPRAYYMSPYPPYPPYLYPPNNYAPIPAPEGISDLNPHVYQPVEQEHNEEPYDENKINEHTTSSSYIIDSGCTPSYIKTPHANNENHPYSTILADESAVRTYGRQKIHVPTQRGKPLVLPNDTYAPAFNRNLMSVSDLTKANNCAVLLHAEGGIITTRSTIPPLSVIHKLRMADGLYHFDAKGKRDTGRTTRCSHNVTPNRKNTFFRTKKPGANRQTIRRLSDRPTHTPPKTTVTSPRLIQTTVTTIPTTRRHGTYYTRSPVSYTSATYTEPPASPL